MASLNHVSMWQDNDWVRITAEEAARLHPGGTVSAHSGLFVCELCGQYVTLTDGDVRARYFKHSASEKDKDCPERTFGSNYTPPSIVAGAHDLPIRLRFISQGFRIELGFIAVPMELLSRYSGQTFTVAYGRENRQSYLFERISEGITTYIPVGKEPARSYSVFAPKEFETYWPKETRGIHSEGAIFSGTTNKLLPIDSDVTIGEAYYLVRQGSRDIAKCRGVVVKKLCEQRIDWLNQWQVYEITATEFCEDSAKFFWNLRYRLTEKPVRMNAVWPIHIETPELIKHDRRMMILQIRGSREVQTQLFPKADIKKLQCEDGSRFVKVDCQARQQLISVGKTKVLQYFYYWKEKLDSTMSEPDIEVIDESGAKMDSGRQTRLPAKGLVQIRLPFDGRIDVLDKGRIVEKRRVSALKTETLYNIQYGTSIQILTGLDVIWKVDYVRGVNKKTGEDEKLFYSLVGLVGDEVKISHSLGSLISRLENYPKTKQWIRSAVKKGYASERALKLLYNHILGRRR